MADNVKRAKRPARVPVVLTEAEVRAVLAQMDGRHALMAGILYGEAVLCRPNSFLCRPCIW